MAPNYQSLLDMLKPKEEESMMSQMTPDQTMALQQPQEIPENYNQAIQEEALNQPVVTPTPAARNITETSQNPFMQGVPDIDAVMANLPKEDSQSPSSNLPQTPMSKSEALLAEYQKMIGKDQEELKAARERDRMLRIGGSVGDALATYLNARSQMNVKAPGVQVQQGAGLGRIADMFATAPEIQSDVAARRQDLLKQYAELAKGERSALDRALKERQVSAYEAQTRAQARKAEREAVDKETTKEAQPSFEEKERIKANVKEEVQVNKENRQLKEKLEPALANVDDQISNVKNAIKLLNESKYVGTGPLDQYFSRLSPEGQMLREALGNIQLDTLVTKFQGMSRAIDTETDRKFFQETQPSMGNFEKTNKKMLENILKRLEGVKAKSQAKLQEISGSKQEQAQPESQKIRREIRQGDNIFDADTKEFIRKAP